MRKQKLWKSMLAVLTCTTLVLSGTLVYAEEQEENGSEFVIEDGVLVEYQGNAEEVIVPEGVSSIGMHAFYGCSSLTSIELPDSVNSIGDYAFTYCSSLTSIELPDSVSSIGDYAFDGCVSLTSINVALQNSEYSSYNGCLYNKDLAELIICPIGKNEVELSDNLITIESCAFYNCSSLTSIELPDSVSNIGNYAFRGCISLTSIELPNSVSSIGNYAFQVCSSLTSIELPDSVSSIGEGVFDGCSSLTSIELPDSVSSIGEWAFDGCSSLTSIELPDSVSSIGESAFTYCRSLTSIKLPESVSSIGKSAFLGCSSLTSIYLPESVSSIGRYAFLDCSLTIFCKEGSYAQQYAIENGINYELIGNSSETPEEVSKYEITLTSESTSITSSEMQELVDINQIHDVVVNSTDGVTFTFPKGTMNMIEGKETYDLGVELITDYSQVTNSPFSEDEFAFRINYNYEGKLPSETTSISIPVDKKWIGQRLYYYRISSDGTYTYLSSAVVDDNGIYTIIQGQCSDYIATLKAPEEQTETPAETDAETPAGKDDSPKTGEADMSLYIALCIAGLAGVFAAGCRKTAR